MIYLRFHSHSHIMIFLSALFIALSFSSCSDDDTPFQDNNLGNGQKEIVFSVETSSDWNNGTSTRASSSIAHAYSYNYLPIVTLTSSIHSNLYLVPEMIDGINLPLKESSESTRSSLTTNETISSFGVFASLHPDKSSSSDAFKPDYMYNVEITKTDGNNWTPEAEYLWPNEASLHINAYSPYSAEETVKSAEGITSLPATDATGNLLISWVTPSEVVNQQDLMWATPKDASSSPCDLTFNHALTAIRFVAGSELSPCTVKKIEVTNVLSSGSLNIETGEWQPADAVANYSVTPDIVLKAADGEAYVASGTAITSDAETMLLLPQSLTETSEIILTIESNGTESTFNASLKNQTWTAGKTVIYSLSANPNSDSDSLILQILNADGVPVSVLKSHYTGVPLDFSVISHHVSVVGGDTTLVNIPWKAEFVDDNGNVVDRPQWITGFDMEGTGDHAYSEPTVMQEPTFAVISDDTRALRSTPDINSTSGNTPYNLSNSTGASGVENTANCYVISAPGKYSIPLVYGNAIKNSVPNTSAYQWNSHAKNILKTFLNHLGNGITDPYIYNNNGCQPKDAYLVWEGRLCLINDVALSDDGHNLTFEVPATYIRQGNALLAVRDQNGLIMWSWQIWVTPHKPTDETRTFTYNGHQYQLMAHNIGELSGGDDTFFTAQSAKVRFTQITDDGTEPKSTVITIDRDATHVVTPFTYSYFQWGRKDPIISLIQQWYKADHTEITQLPTKAYVDRPTDLDFVATCIRTPEVFWTTSHDGNEPSFDYVNLWNVKSTDRNGVKSVYDPSPAGFMVPGIMLDAFANGQYPHTYIGTDANYPRLSYTLDDGELLIPLLGYRSSNDGNEASNLTQAPLWLNNASVKDGYDIPFHDSDFTRSSMARAMGYGIRPMKEP